MTAAPGGAFTGGLEWCPELGATIRSKLEGTRQNADDGVWITAEGNGLSDDVFSACEAVLPRGVGDEGGLGSVRLVFTLVEVAAEEGSDAECAEESIADTPADDHLCPAGRVEHIVSASVGLYRAEDGIEALPVEVVGVGEV